MKCYLFPLLFVSTFGFAQSTNVPLNEDYQHWIDRYEVKAGIIAPEMFTSIKPYKRKAIVSFLDSIAARGQIFTSQTDKGNVEFLKNDNWEWSKSTTNDSRPFLKYFYSKKSDWLHVDKPEFDLHVNPVVYLGLGKDSRSADFTTINTRGFELRGMIDRKVGFYTYVTENQSLLPMYVRDQLAVNPVLPHETFWKQYKQNGVDFFQARAYIDFNISKHIYFQFGQDRTFIGNGYRSLIFSDYSPPNLFLRTNLKVWKINYLFQLNRLTADAYGTVGGSTNSVYPDKYMAFHHASINIGKKLNLGVFESVVFSPKDSLSNANFDPAYLNPIIFYRAVEQQNGSGNSNVILGADFKWNAWRGVSFYGQFVLDEFVIKQILSGNGWWANKFSFQTGMKLIDVAGISNLDLQVEANYVKPYTYSHSSYSSYTHFRQSLAHPMGANLIELVGIIRYQPVAKLNLVSKTFGTTIGRDEVGQNYGSDLMKRNAARANEFGNFTGQGTKNTVLFSEFTASYQLKHNLFFDLKQLVRISKSTDPFYNTNARWTSLSVRLNIAPRSYDF
jgi:hypothetical protein